MCIRDRYVLDEVFAGTGQVARNSKILLHDHTEPRRQHLLFQLAEINPVRAKSLQHENVAGRYRSNVVSDYDDAFTTQILRHQLLEESFTVCNVYVGQEIE